MDKNKSKVDIAIIGAGVVGCAIARELSIQYPNKNIVVLEKLTGVGLETSSFNSGVLHSGIHQNPNFLKSRLVEKGNKIAADYVKSKELPIIDSGMLIVVSFQAIKEGLYKELASLWNLLKNGKKHRIPVKFLLRAGVKKLAPNIKALGGIFIPNVLVINPLQFTQELAKDAEMAGVRFLFKNPVVGIKKSKDMYILSTPEYSIRAGAVINAAGLYADDVARMAGFDDYKVYPWRGEYYEILGDKAKLVKRLVYPAMPKNSKSKGIHFSPRVDGRLFVGPNNRAVNAKDYYTQDKTPPDVFLKYIQKYLPQIQKEDLRWAYSGIRPKITSGAEESDFIINVDSKNPLFINLIGIESPGLTSSMAIAKYVYQLANEIMK